MRRLETALREEEAAVRRAEAKRVDESECREESEPQRRRKVFSSLGG